MDNNNSFSLEIHRESDATPTTPIKLNRKNKFMNRLFSRAC